MAPRVRGRSIATAKKLTKPALACKLAQAILKEAEHDMTLSAMARVYAVSVPLIRFAMNLPEPLRADIASGKADPNIYRDLFQLTRAKEIVLEPVEIIAESPLKVVA
jgi:hypothetical protein